MAEYIEKKGYCEYLATQEGDFLDDYGKGWSAAIAEARRIAEKFTVPPAYPVKDRETLIEEAVEGRALRIAADIMAAAVCAGGVILEREVRNAAEYCEDMEMALSLLREKRLVNGTSIYPLLGEGIDDLFSHNEQIRIWVLSPDTGHSTCVWKGMAWMMPTEVRRLPLLRVSARAPEETEVVGYLEIETELPEGWKMKDAAGCGHPALRETGARADVGIGPYERASGVAEGMEDGTVCPRCGGRVYHTVGGKKFCSLCLEEMRRE